MNTSLVKGIICYTTCIFLVALMDVAAKLVVSNYSIQQILFFRSFFALIPIALLLSTTRENWRQVGNAKLQVIRGIGASAVFCSFVYSLKYLPLVDAAALSFTGPFFMVIMGVLILKERTNLVQITAIVCGFIGMLFVLKPKFEYFGFVALLPIAAGFISSLVKVSTRLLTNVASTLSIVFWGTIVSVLVSCLFLPFGWVSITAQDLPILVLIGILGGTSMFFLCLAFKFVAVSTVAPLEYTLLLWMAIMGYVIWRDIPSASVLIGLIIIVGAGLSIFYSEKTAHSDLRK